MKWMGGWSWAHYQTCPEDVLAEIVVMIGEENEEAKRTRPKKRL